jgi:hypothetical protein
MADIRWKRSIDDFVESHDGNWRIVPNYSGCVRPQSFRLVRDGKIINYHCATQREAKATAARWLEGT